MQYLFLNYQHCTCKLDIGGGMVYCDNKKCPRGAWFHYECVDVQEDELTEEKWYCSEECKKGSVRKPKKNRNAIELINPKLKYVQSFMMHGIRDKVRTDAVRENDGARMIRHWKFDIIYLFQNNHPKYYVYAIRLQANVAGAASLRLRFQIQNNRTVHIRGGKGCNVANNLHDEHLDNRYKGTI